MALGTFPFSQYPPHLFHSLSSQLQCLQMHNGAIIRNLIRKFRILTLISSLIVRAMTEKNQLLFYLIVYPVMMLVGLIGN